MSQSREQFLAERVQDTQRALAAKRQEWYEASSREALDLIKLGLEKPTMSSRQVAAELQRIHDTAERDKSRILALANDVDRLEEQLLDYKERLDKAIADSGK